MAHKNPSPLRQELNQLLAELEEIAALFARSTPLWKGTVYVLRRRCGKPNCRCTEGELHETTVLSDRSGKRPRTIPLEGNDINRFRSMTQRYRRVRSARARVTKMTKRILCIVDQLTDIRLKEGQKKYKKRK
jgi:hypothetical protein